MRSVRHRPLALGAVLVVLAAAGLLGVQVLLGRGSEPLLVAWGLAETVLAVLAGGLCLWSSRTRPRGLRFARGAFAGFCLSWSCGQGMWMVRDVLGVGLDPTTWADLPFSIGYVLLVVSAVAHLRARSRTHVGVRTAIDGALLGLSLFTVVWVLWLGSAVAGSGFPAADLVVPIANPVVDVVFLTLTLVTLMSGGRTRSGVLVLVGGAAFAVADVAYSYGILRDDYVTGGVCDVAYVLAFGTFCLLALPDPGRRAPQGPTTSESRGRLVPYLALLPATCAGAWRLWSASDRVVLTALLAVVVLVVLRQFLTVEDHRRLLVTAERQRGQLDTLAHVDALTGLENRRRFGDRIAEAVRAALVDDGSLTVAFVDLDRFKAVNDTLGHAAGDELLRGVACRLRAAVRDEDCVARLGGDEFAVLVTDAAVPPGPLVERLRQALVEPFVLAGTAVTASASTGAVQGEPRSLLAGLPVAPDLDLDARVEAVVEALLGTADAEMYRVKRAHRAGDLTRDPVAP